jgi:hypothetical protein
MLQEDSKPILDDRGDVIQLAANTAKGLDEPSSELVPVTHNATSNCLGVPVDWNKPNATYCTHIGPCNESCPCSIQGAACESACHVSTRLAIHSPPADMWQCDLKCPRRWGGCKCRADPKNPKQKCVPGKCPCLLARRECDPFTCGYEPV